MVRTDRAILTTICLTGGIAGSLCGTQSLAYPVPVDFDGKLLKWEVSDSTDPVVYEVINDSALADTTTDTMVSASAELWSNVPGSKLRLVEASDKPGQLPMITVSFQSAFDGGNFSAAYAVFDEYNDNDEPVHCKVKVAVRGSEAANDLQKTVLHELGHCLGLGHSLFPKAIMSYRLEENSFALDADDRAAIVRLYPEDDTVAQLPAGCSIGHGGQSKKSQKSSADFTLFFLPFLASAWRLVRSRHKVRDRCE